MGLVKPKKFLGQHFLKDLSIAKDIADTVDVCPDLPILEVGPGMGVLTQFIMQKNRPVKAVEQHFQFVYAASKRFHKIDNHQGTFVLQLILVCLIVYFSNEMGLPSVQDSQ